MMSAIAESTRHRMDLAVRDYELLERNQRTVESWRVRRAKRMAFPDALCPTGRALFNRWFTQEHDIALRYLFKSRCERRNTVRLHQWAHLHKAFHRQAE